MCEHSCYYCTRREGFVCFGLCAHENFTDGVDMRKHTYGTDIEIRTEEDLKKIGHKCFMFKTKVWCVS